MHWRKQMWWLKQKNTCSCENVGLTTFKKPDESKEEEFLDLNKIAFIKSPNFSKRTDEVRCLVLHHTGSTNFNGTVSWLCNKQAQASAHYVIGLDGTINQLVKLEDASWNVGKSEWMIDGKKRIGLNSCSIGIEIVNIGMLEKGADGKFYYEEGRNLKEWKGEVPVESKIVYPDGKEVEGFGVRYPEKQLKAVFDLCKALINKYPAIGAEDVLTHFQVATPVGRKNDPFCLDLSSLKDKLFKH
jgi:N-acetylmuramoyl-L-alanine amidase